MTTVPDYTPIAAEVEVTWLDGHVETLWALATHETPDGLTITTADGGTTRIPLGAVRYWRRTGDWRTP